MSRKQHRRNVAWFASLVTVIPLLCVPAECQTAPESKPKKKADSQAATDVVRWQYMLDDLAREARAISQEEKRPLLLAEVADAYWELDQAKARDLFTSALEAALSLKGETKEAGQALRHVIRLATKRDSLLARRLLEKMLGSAAEKKWASGESMSVAVELLETDSAGAALLAEANAPFGPSMDSAWFTLQLSRRDPAAADRVYGAYLSRFAPNTGFGLERLHWLSGYPFGYAEAFGGALNPSRMVGFSGLRISGLTARPALARAFLDVALLASQNALVRAGSATPERAEALNGLVLYTAAYLRPEVQRYRPQTLPAWSQVEQQALAGTTTLQKDAVSKRVQEIIGARPPAGRQETAESYVGGEAEDLLARAEKLPAGCQRDTEFAKAALGIGYGKDFPRALEVSDRVTSESIRDSVRQFIYYDMSYAALTRGDPTSLDDAQKYAERVTPPEQRALLYIKIAKAVPRDRGRQLASGLLEKTVRLADAVSEPTHKASILLAAAAGFAEFDTFEGYKALVRAVKTVNSAKSPNVDNFLVMRKVNLACRAGEDTWYGNSDRAERFSLFETFATMASADVDGVLSLARDLEDPPTRIRSLIHIARAMTKKPHGVSPASPPR